MRCCRRWRQQNPTVLTWGAWSNSLVSGCGQLSTWSCHVIVLFEAMSYRTNIYSIYPPVFRRKFSRLGLPLLSRPKAKYDKICISNSCFSFRALMLQKFWPAFRTNMPATCQGVYGRNCHRWHCKWTIAYSDFLDIWKACLSLDCNRLSFVTCSAARV